jgi:hypothetical protein
MGRFAVRKFVNPQTGLLTSLCRSRLWHLLFLFLFVATSSYAARSRSRLGRSPQEDTGKLDTITITGSSRYTSDQIVPASGLHHGDTITKQTLQEAANRLAQLGYFTNVSYRFTSNGNLVDVTYSLQDAPTISIAFDNFPWFTDDEIRQSIRRDVPLFDGSAPTTGTIPDDIAAAIQKLMLAHGIHAQVLRQEALGGVTSSSEQLVFSAQGDSLPIASLEFTDPLATQDQGLRLRMSDIVGKPYSRFGVEVFNFEQVRPIYLAHGYLDVQFATPEARFPGPPNHPPDKVVVRDSINPGKTYTWSGVTWSGNQALPSTDLVRLTPFAPGSMADGVKIQGAWENVGKAYRHIGYLDVKVDAQQHLDNTSCAASYTITVSEGIKYHMGELILSGMSLESERRLRAGWGIPKGATFDEAYYDNFVSSDIKKAIAGLPVHVDKVGSALEKHPDTAAVDVLIDFH